MTHERLFVGTPKRRLHAVGRPRMQMWEIFRIEINEKRCTWSLSFFPKKSKKKPVHAGYLWVEGRCQSRAYANDSYLRNRDKKKDMKKNEGQKKQREVKKKKT